MEFLNMTDNLTHWMNSSNSLMDKNDKHAHAFEDKSLKGYLAFQVAWGLDIGLTPICSTLGIIGNIMSFIVLMTSKKTTTYQYMAMIALTDILILILNIMLLIRNFFEVEIYYEETCGLIYFLMYFSIHYNVILLMTMTLERFLAIKYPLNAQRWLTIKIGRIIIAVEGILVVAFDFHHFFTRILVVNHDTGMNKCPEVKSTTYFIKKVWPWINGITYCYLPLSVLFILNILIIRVIQKSGNTRRKMIQNDNSQQTSHISESKAQERQITIMLLLVSFCFMILVSPMAVLIILKRQWIPVEPRDKATYYLVKSLTHHMKYLNHALNFPLYFLSGKRFRDAFRTVFCKFLKQNKTTLSNPYPDKPKRTLAAENETDSKSASTSNITSSLGTISSAVESVLATNTEKTPHKT